MFHAYSQLHASLVMNLGFPQEDSGRDQGKAIIYECESLSRLHVNAD